MTYPKRIDGKHQDAIRPSTGSAFWVEIESASIQDGIRYRSFGKAYTTVLTLSGKDEAIEEKEFLLDLISRGKSLLEIYRKEEPLIRVKFGDPKRAVKFHIEAKEFWQLYDETVQNIFINTVLVAEIEQLLNGEEDTYTMSNDKPYSNRPPAFLTDDYSKTVQVTVVHAYDPIPIMYDKSLAHLNGLDRIIMLSARTSEKAKRAYLVVRANLRSYPVGKYVLNGTGTEQQWYVVGKEGTAYVTMIKTVSVQKPPSNLRHHFQYYSSRLAEL